MPLLPSVSVCCAVEPATALKEKLVLSKVNAEVVTLPVRATVTGLPEEESLAITKEPV